MELSTLGLLLYLPTAAAAVVSPQPPFYPGDTVTLSCDVAEHTDWDQYYWYRGSDNMYTTNRQSTTIYLPDQAGQYHYTCKGTRGKRPLTSQRSTPVPVSVRAFPKPELTVQPSHVFSGETVTLTCAIQPSSGWTYAWYKHMRYRWLLLKASETNTYTISRATMSEQGEYKCSGVRESSWTSAPQSNTVQITVEDGDVILESPVHPVTEGDPLTLRCRYRYPSNISADFYKNGTLLQTSTTGEMSIPAVSRAHEGLYKQTSTTGEMTIPAVSRSHEGLYKCSNPERGESQESWVTVRVSGSGSSELVEGVGVVIRLLIAFALVIFLAILLYHSYKVKGSSTVERKLDQQMQTTNQSSDLDQTTNQSRDPDQRTNQSSDPDQRNQIQSAGREGTQSEYMPLQNRSTDDYDTLTPLYMPLQKGTTDVYETIKPSKDSQEDCEEGYDDVDLPDI
ncbi:high affinity immunoglobulin gamma Fc receptor I-like isoform X2 [Alosa pseudoharengus]|uniref:high affinity immunoglobulin gamma Fc receptor I-like isoform X2 n=1 Tax=Alosa pseudoharengus TaxID=34774 RepID=UPI003F8B1861